MSNLEMFPYGGITGISKLININVDEIKSNIDKNGYYDTIRKYRGHIRTNLTNYYNRPYVRARTLNDSDTDDCINHIEYLYDDDKIYKQTVDDTSDNNQPVDKYEEMVISNQDFESETDDEDLEQLFDLDNDNYL